MRTREDLMTFPRSDTARPFSVESAGISYCQGDYIVRRKNADIYVFEYVRKGAGTVVNNGTQWAPVQGDIYLLKAGSDHTYYADSKNPWEKIWFNVYGDLIEKMIDLYGLRDVTVVTALNCNDLFEKFYHIVRSDLPYEELCSRCAIIFLEIIIRIYERISTPHPYPPDALYLKDLLDRSIERSICVDELAGAIFRSRSQTIRIFRTAFHQTPYDYLLELKLDRAKTLLTQTNLSIKEIAYRLRFTDEHYFSRLFKKKAGVSPEFYRKGSSE